MNNLQATLHVANPLLLLAVIVNDVVEGLIRNHDLALLELNLLPNLRQQIVVRNHNLLLRVIPLRLDAIHSVPQNRIHLPLIIVAEDEEATTQIEFHLGEILVTKLHVLRRVNQVRQNAVDFLALGSIANLIDLIKQEYYIHASCINYRLSNLAPNRPLVSDGVTLQETAVLSTTERNKCKRTLQNLADSILDQTGLSGSRRSVNSNCCANRLRISEQLTEQLHDLHLCVVQTIDSIIQRLLCFRHKLVALLNSVVNCDGEAAILVERNLHESVDPSLQLVVVAISGLHVAECINLLHCGSLVLDGYLGLQQRHPVRLFDPGYLVNLAELLDNLVLLVDIQVVVEGEVVVHILVLQNLLEDTQILVLVLTILLLLLLLAFLDVGLANFDAILNRRIALVHLVNRLQLGKSLDVLFLFASQSLLLLDLLIIRHIVSHLIDNLFVISLLLEKGFVHFRILLFLFLFLFLFLLFLIRRDRSILIFSIFVIVTLIVIVVLVIIVVHPSDSEDYINFLTILLVLLILIRIARRRNIFRLALFLFFFDNLLLFLIFLDWNVLLIRKFLLLDNLFLLIIRLPLLLIVFLLHNFLNRFLKFLTSLDLLINVFRRKQRRQELTVLEDIHLFLFLAILLFRRGRGRRRKLLLLVVFGGMNGGTSDNSGLLLSIANHFKC